MQSRLSIWAPLPPDVYFRRPRRERPFPLQRSDCRLVAWARHGIWRGVKELGLGHPDVVLVPAYNHGSEVEALVRAGLECRFYAGDADLAPTPDELESLLDERVRALYLIDFLGFPQDAARWRAWCDERGLLLIEDAAQAWLAARDGRPAGSCADLAVFCLYKTFGLPEGAAVVGPSSWHGPGLDRALGVLELVRRNGRWLAARSPLVAGLRDRVRRPPVPEPAADDFALRDPGAGPWAHTPFLLRRIADPAAAERRRRHYAELLEALHELVPRPFDRLPAGAAPFVFPIAVDDKARVLERLLREGVVALDLWRQTHPAVPADRFPAAARRRARTLGLPVHQELRSGDLRRIARATLAATGRAR